MEFGILGWRKDLERALRSRYCFAQRFRDTAPEPKHESTNPDKLEPLEGAA
jgi:hypothetical protein